MKVAPSSSVVVGIDVAKNHLDGYVRPHGERLAWPTDPDSLAALAERLRRLEAQLIVLEASGGYEAPIAAALAAADLPVAIVNPRQVRQFAGAIGRLAKLVLGPANGRTRGTDAIDAAVIAHFAEAIRPAPRPLPDDLTRRLRELLARRQLVIMISAMAGAAGGPQGPALPRLSAQGYQSPSHRPLTSTDSRSPLAGEGEGGGLPVAIAD